MINISSKLNKRISSFSFKSFFADNRNQVLILLGLALISYVNSFNNEFLSDDIDGIVLNKEIDKFSYVFKGFPPNLQNSIYYFTVLIFGRIPFFLRIFNNFIPHLKARENFYPLFIRGANSYKFFL